MKTIIIFLLSIYSISFAIAQNESKRDLGNFNKLKVEDGILVQLVKSDKESIEITTQEIETSKVISEMKDGGKLILRVDVPPLTKYKVMVKLYYTEINGIEASSGSEISTNSLMKQDSLSIKLISGAKAYLDLDIKHLSSKVIEGGVLSAEGYAVKSDGYTATSGTLSLFELESEEVVVKAVTGGKIKINVEKSLIAHATSGGYIAYKGNPGKKDIKSGIGGKIEQYTE